MRSMFLRLTELGEGVAETRRRVAIDELVPEGALARGRRRRCWSGSPTRGS